MDEYVYFIYLPSYNSYECITINYNEAVEEFQRRDGKPYLLAEGGICYPRVELLRYSRDRYTGALSDMTVLAASERRPVLIYD